MKTCSKCKEQKPLSEFHKQRKSPDGLAWYCKKCKQEQAREWRRSPSGLDTEKRRNKSLARYAQIKSRYGLDKHGYHALIDGAGHCQICGAEFTGREPMIDHNHLTGKVRGLLCQSCNSMLGYAKDNAAILRAAIEYLESTASSAESNACGEESSGGGLAPVVKLASVKQESSAEPTYA